MRIYAQRALRKRFHPLWCLTILAIRNKSKAEAPPTGCSPTRLRTIHARGTHHAHVPADDPVRAPREACVAGGRADGEFLHRAKKRPPPLVDLDLRSPLLRVPPAPRRRPRRQVPKLTFKSPRSYLVLEPTSVAWYQNMRTIFPPSGSIGRPPTRATASEQQNAAAETLQLRLRCVSSAETPRSPRLRPHSPLGRRPGRSRTSRGANRSASRASASRLRIRRDASEIGQARGIA